VLLRSVPCVTPIGAPSQNPALVAIKRGAIRRLRPAIRFIPVSVSLVTIGVSLVTKTLEGSDPFIPASVSLVTIGVSLITIKWTSLALSGHTLGEAAALIHNPISVTLAHKN